MRCPKCGGGGDMFLLQSKKESHPPQQRVENWKWYLKQKKWWKVIGNIEYSLCNGFGKVEGGV